MKSFTVINRSLLLILLLCSSLAALEKPPKLLQVGGGIFNIIKGKKTALGQIEYRGDSQIYLRKYLFIRPLLGAMGTTDLSLYLYGGLAFDVFLGKSVVFTPSFAPGMYFRGHGKDLGYLLEFRSAVELAYRLKSEWRMGSQFYHISNGSFGTKNPGTECLVFFISIPLNKK